MADETVDGTDRTDALADVLRSAGHSPEDARRIAAASPERAASARAGLQELEDELAATYPATATAPGAAQHPDQCMWPGGCTNPRAPRDGDTGRSRRYCEQEVEGEYAGVVETWLHDPEGAKRWRRTHGGDTHREAAVQPLVDVGALRPTDVPTIDDLSLPTSILEHELRVVLDAAHRSSVTATGAHVVAADLLRQFPAEFIEAAQRAIARLTGEHRGSVAGHELRVIEEQERGRSLAAQVNETARALAATTAQLEAATERIADLEETEATLSSERDRAAGQVSSLEAELAQTTARADAAEVELEQVRAELASQRQLAEERQMLNTRLEDDLAVAREETQRAGQRVEAVEADAAVRVGAAEQELATVQQELVTSNSELTRREQDAQAARARIDEQSETIALLREEHDELRETARTAEQLRTQVATLQGAYDRLLERVGAGSEGTTAKKTATTRKRSARERNDD